MIKRITYTLVFWLLSTLTVLANEDSARVEEVSIVGFTVKKLSRPGNSIDKYLVYMPDKYRRWRVQRWPVIFFLHGKGERGNDINKVRSVGITEMLGLSKNDFPFILIVPQCKPNAGQWELPSLDVLYEEVMRTYPVDTKRVYLTGLSMGGYGAWNWASANPERFAAIVPVCGYGLSRLNPCGMKDLPIWTFHNTDDKTVSVRETRRIVQAVKACGNTQIYYTERPTGGHDAWSKVYSSKEVFLWMLSKRKP